jgi:hypothetical protein
MKQPILAAVVILSVLPTRNVEGHGSPIHVDVADSKLVVSQGLSDPMGFASMIYVEDDDDGDPFGSVEHPQLGPLIIWQLPGLDIFGMDDSSSLSMEVLSRPVKDTDPVEERLLWYWNPGTELVEPATVDFHLLGTGARSLTLSATDPAPPPPFMLADPVAGEQGFHNHGLLAYGLEDDSPPAGAYGFFARLTSNQYTSSDPFLVVFNNHVAYSQMVPAALAINAAGAGTARTGDMDCDGDVDFDDIDDFALGLNDPEAYLSMFGVAPALKGDTDQDGDHDFDDISGFVAILTGSGGLNAVRRVPEPMSLTLVAVGFCALVCVERVRRGVRSGS